MTDYLRIIEQNDEIEKLKNALRICGDALELIIVDVNTTPNAYEAHRRALNIVEELVGNE